MSEVQLYKKKFKCIPNDSVALWGDYNSARTQQLEISFQMCQDDPECKTEAEVREWLKRKYILLLFN